LPEHARHRGTAGIQVALWDESQWCCAKIENAPCSFPATSKKFPDPSTREFVSYRFEKLEELRANFHEIGPFAVNFPVFSRLSGNPYLRPVRGGLRPQPASQCLTHTKSVALEMPRNGGVRLRVYDEVKAERDRLADRPYSWPLARK
jgi:hypothetical protein